jgi:hypothetical protein
MALTKIHRNDHRFRILHISVNCELYHSKKFQWISLIPMVSQNIITQRSNLIRIFILHSRACEAILHFHIK